MAESDVSSHSFNIREKSRQEHKVCRQLNRSHKYNVKRLHINDLERNFQCVTNVEMAELTDKVKRSCKDIAVLRRLKQGFGESDEHREYFIRVSGAVRGLVCLLSGHDAVVQLESAACFVNLLASEHKTIKPVIKQASSYLVLYLRSNSDPLKELCALALGNLCADSIDCCSVLKSQGFLSNLLSLLTESTSESVIVSSLFALGCYLVNKPDDHRLILELGLEKTIARFLLSRNRSVIVESAKIVFYLSTRQDFDSVLLGCGAVDGIIRHLHSRIVYNQNQFIDQTDCQILTFFVRTLAAVCSEEEAVVVGLLASSYNCRDVFLFLISVNHEHLVKESLWFLCNVASYKTDSVVNLFENELLLRSIVTKLFGPVDIIEEAINCLCNVLELQCANIASILSSLVTNETLLRLLLSSNKTTVANTLILVSQLMKSGSWTNSERNLEVIHGLADASDDLEIKTVAAAFLRLFHL